MPRSSLLAAAPVRPCTPSAPAPTTTALSRDSGRDARCLRIGPPDPHRDPLHDRRHDHPGDQHVVLEIVQAPRRVAAQREDGDQRHPGREDVDGGIQQALVEPVRPGEGQREDEQAQRQGRSVHPLVRDPHDHEEGQDRDAGLHEGGHERRHRLRRAVEGPLVGAIFEHGQGRGSGVVAALSCGRSCCLDRTGAPEMSKRYARVEGTGSVPCILREGRKPPAPFESGGASRRADRGGNARVRALGRGTEPTIRACFTVCSRWSEAR